MKIILLKLLLFVLNILLLPSTIIVDGKIYIYKYLDERKHPKLKREYAMPILRKHGDMRPWKQVEISEFMRRLHRFNIPDGISVRVTAGSAPGTMVAGSASPPNKLELIFDILKDKPDYFIRDIIDHELVHLKQISDKRLVHIFRRTKVVAIIWEGVRKSKESWKGVDVNKYDILGNITHSWKYINLPWEIEAYRFNGIRKPLKYIKFLYICRYIIQIYLRDSNVFNLLISMIDETKL